AAVSCDDATQYNQDISITAPPYSETGEYDVTMQAGAVGTMGRREHLVSVNGGTYSGLAGTSAVENGLGTFTARYGTANPQPTGQFDYRFNFCYSETIVNGHSECYEQTATFTTVDTATTVLRDPGSVGPL